jgi:hypothetical protein
MKAQFGCKLKLHLANSSQPYTCVSDPLPSLPSKVHACKNHKDFKSITKQLNINVTTLGYVNLSCLDFTAFWRIPVRPRIALLGRLKGLRNPSRRHPPPPPPRPAGARVCPWHNPCGGRGRRQQGSQSLLVFMVLMPMGTHPRWRRPPSGSDQSTRPVSSGGGGLLPDLVWLGWMWSVA